MESALLCEEEFPLKLTDCTALHTWYQFKGMGPTQSAKMSLSSQNLGKKQLLRPL